MRYIRTQNNQGATQAVCSACRSKLIGTVPHTGGDGFDEWRDWVEKNGWDLSSLSRPLCPKCRPAPWRHYDGDQQFAV